MTVSLYAIGPAKIEVGKFGMSLTDATAAFLAICSKHNFTPKITDKHNSKKFDFEFNLNPKLNDLLHEVAKVADLHGDPPFTYILADNGDVPVGKYIKTGEYND